MRKRVVQGIFGLIVVFLIGLVSGGVLLKRGLHWQEFSFGPISLLDCSLSWQDSLLVDIGSLKFSKGQSRPEASSQEINGLRLFKIAQKILTAIQRISIAELNLGFWQGTLTVERIGNQRHSLNVLGKDLQIKATVHVRDSQIIAEINSLKSKKYNSDLSGTLLFDPAKSQGHGNISALINGNFPIEVEFVADKEKLSFIGKEAAKITSITPLVDLFGLKHSIQRWITEYLSGSQYHLKTLSGNFPWNSPVTLLDTLSAEVRVDDCEYVFAEGFEPVKAKYTDVYFKKGVLLIKPYDATFYGQNCETSWVDIDFNDLKNILLTIYLDTHAQLNDDILVLLEHYKIPLPFKQLEGKTATQLTLAINLKNTSVLAKGQFQLHRSRLAFGPKSIDISDALIVLENNDVTIKRLRAASPFVGEVLVSGSYSVASKQLELIGSLEKPSIDGLVLDEQTLPFTLGYDGNLTISVAGSHTFSYKGVSGKLSPLEIKYSNNLLTLGKTGLRYGDFFDAKISGDYDTRKKRGTVILNDLFVLNESFGPKVSPDVVGSDGISTSGDPLLVLIVGEKSALSITIDALDFLLDYSVETGLVATFSDVEVLTKYWKVLEQFTIEGGNVKLSLLPGEKPLLFSSELITKTPLLMRGTTPVKDLRINGEMEHSRITARVNEDLLIEYKEKQLDIFSSNNLGYNIPGLLNIFRKTQNKGEDKNTGTSHEPFVLRCNAKNTGLFIGPGSSIPADQLQLDYRGGEFKAMLDHGAGHMDFNSRGDSFDLEGKKLNDVFLEALFTDSDFKGGETMVVAHGLFSAYSVLIEMKETILMNYAVANNILAFINTIPALATFSRPEYNREGFPIQSAVIGTVVEKNYATITSMAIHSSQLDIAGSGWLDFNNKKIDVDLGFITRSKTNVRKIPLLGRIAAGEDDESTATLKISGDMNNPSIKNSILREIVVLPFEVLLRTLKLPKHLAEGVGELINDEN